MGTAHCSMCMPLHYYDTAENKCLARTNEKGINQCHSHLGWARAPTGGPSSTGKCFKCYNDWLLNTDRDSCSKIASKDEAENLQGCRIGETNWVTGRPAQLSHVGSRCWLCNDNYLMSGPAGIRCQWINKIVMDHSETEIGTRKVSTSMPEAVAGAPAAF